MGLSHLNLQRSIPEKEEAQPAIVLFRGGSRLHAVPSFNPKDSSFPYLLATDAVIILASYRDGLSPGSDEYGGSDVEDVKYLMDYLPSLAKQLSLCIDEKHLYGAGISRGAMQLFFALSQFKELQQKFCKCVSNCGILDIENFARNNPEVAEKWKNHFDCTSSDWLKKKNLLRFVAAIQRDFPVLIVQGSKDPKIPSIDANGFVEKLKAMHFKDVTYLEIADGNHALKNKNGAVGEILGWLMK